MQTSLIWVNVRAMKHIGNYGGDYRGVS